MPKRCPEMNLTENAGIHVTEAFWTNMEKWSEEYGMNSWIISRHWILESMI